ncbi:hypothetical protein RRF57_003524 [Xylaria bambusicola]|uniref:DUF7582 domain-containing protein n=1 Tax=Xylaria bambusicola TaxID=326684 RepID=A0AAN7UKU4_9PEZI
MSLSKQRISSPLEAGRSILDAHNLPPQLTSTMEYASKRFARKNLHITLIVVKNEYQLPTVRPCATPTSPPQTPEYSASGLASPSRFTSPVVGLRQLVRRGTGSSIASTSSGSSTSSASSETASSALMSLSPTFSPLPTEPIASPRRWILPLTPGSPLPSTPMTPHTPSSIATITTAASSYATSHPFQNPESFGVRLIYTAPISPRDEKMIRATITKAERKFHIGVGRTPPVMSASACGLSADLVRRSIQQNEVLFSSEGLTLLGLDRLYSFKAALAAYAKSIITPSSRMQSPLSSPGLSNHPINTMPPPTSIPTTTDSSRLEDAVDCLRRLVLANGSRPVPKADIYRSFDWMSVNATALADVESMYRRAYGGLERRGPFESPPIPKSQEPTQENEDAKRMGFIKIGTPPPPKAQTTPVLKLNTNITTTPRPIKPKPKVIAQASGSTESNRAQQINSSAKSESKNNAEALEIRFDCSEIATEKHDNCAEEDGDRTPHPLRDGPVRPSMFWPNGNALGQSIDEMLSPCDYRQSQRLGPLTPNGYDDISPITRGEWGFLFKGDTWTQGRTAVVETC